jgi:K+-sensing histidine kinase KdpD
MIDDLRGPLDFPHFLHTITRCLGDLGLSVVGEIVTAHDGRILAKPRRATTFAA